MPRKSSKRRPTSKRLKALERERTLNENAALEVISLFEHPHIPDFVTDAVMLALKEAAHVKRVNIWNGEEEFDSKVVGDLFADTKMLSLEPTPKQRVVDAVHEILNNPQTPGDLFEHVAEFVTETLNNSGDSDQLVHTSPMLSLILDACPEDELMGARRAARAAEQAG